MERVARNALCAPVPSGTGLEREQRISRFHVGPLIDILNGHELSGFWSTDARLKDEYEKRIAPR